MTALGLLAALPACAQYPGQITKEAKDTPELRAVAVLEWTGEAGKPKTSRLVPVSVFDGVELQDGGVYLARPQPLAVDGGVEYVLQKDGRRIGLFEIRGSGQEQGSWVGFGVWKPMPGAAPKRPAAELALNRVDDEGGDRPLLHRKAHPGDSTASGAGTGSSGTGSSGTGGTGAGGTGAGSASSGGQAPAADPDRPTLHKKTSSDDTGSEGSSPAPDSDRPTLHKASSAGDSAGAPADDDDRPTLTRAKAKKTADTGYVEDLPGITDPDRPRLMRGKSAGGGPAVIPTLMGLPPDMEQAVAVSDAANRPEHPWNYTWANPADEVKLKADLEDIARGALGLNTPPPAAAPAPKRTAARRKAKAAPAPPAPLEGEQFRVFELAYGSGATLVLSAHTGGPLAQQQFVTLIAQPDLYGSLLVLFKSVTSGGRLDQTPRMRLIDAVDAMADNRGELLFELRGATQRQFALYRVLRGNAEKLFVTGGGYFGSLTTP
ncbi:MAG: hypothetical protein WBM14_09190 [Terracidiphilus sp.]